MQMDWWYDIRRLDRCTVEELAAQFRLGLIGLTSEAAQGAADSRADGDARIVTSASIRPSPGSLRKNSRAQVGAQ